MSTLYNGSICLSDIPKEKITTSEKNGKKYLNFNLWVNDEKDQYGNIGSINVSQTKAERDTPGNKKVYFGNIKPVERKEQPLSANDVEIKRQLEKYDPADDQLPF
jgi:hypothetical protein